MDKRNGVGVNAEKFKKIKVEGLSDRWYEKWQHVFQADLAFPKEYLLVRNCLVARNRNSLKLS